MKKIKYMIEDITVHSVTRQITTPMTPCPTCKSISGNDGCEWCHGEGHVITLFPREADCVYEDGDD